MFFLLQNHHFDVEDVGILKNRLQIRIPVLDSLYTQFKIDEKCY